MLSENYIDEGIYVRKNDGHIIISGTGRAGTTLLVQYFTYLGLDTGYTPEEAMENVDKISRAGLEHDLRSPNLPKIIKSPWFADTISDVMKERALNIDAAIIPVRALKNAAESRRRIYSAALSIGSDPLTHPGTIWKTDNPEDQEIHLALQLYKLIESITEYNILTYFIPFPGFADDHNILYSCIYPILNSMNISKEESRNAHGEVVNMSLINYR